MLGVDIAWIFGVALNLINAQAIDFMDAKELVMEPIL